MSMLPGAPANSKPAKRAPLLSMLPVKLDMPRSLYRQKINRTPELKRGEAVRRRAGWWPAILAIVTGRKPA